MNVTDVTAALALAAADAGTEAVVVALTAAPPVTWWLVYLPPGARWEGVALPGVVTAALVLEGLATWATDGVRQTLASGHLVQAPEGVALSAHNDGDQPVAALVQQVEAVMPEVFPS